jgi:hypothetical protein
MHRRSSPPRPKPRIPRRAGAARNSTDAIEIIKTPPCAPRANAICERLAGMLRRELSGRILIVGPGHARRVGGEYAAYYNGHRPHQSLNQRHPNAVGPTVPAVVGLDERRIICIPVLCGLIHRYHEAAGMKPGNRSSQPGPQLRAAQSRMAGRPGRTCARGFPRAARARMRAGGGVNSECDWSLPTESQP